MAGSDRDQDAQKPSEQRGGTTPDEAEAREKGAWAGQADEGVVPAELGGSDAPRDMLADDPELGSSVLGQTTGSDEPATDERHRPERRRPRRRGDRRGARRPGGRRARPQGRRRGGPRGRARLAVGDVPARRRPAHPHGRAKVHPPRGAMLPSPVRAGVAILAAMDLTSRVLRRAGLRRRRRDGRHGRGRAAARRGGRMRTGPSPSCRWRSARVAGAVVGARANLASGRLLVAERAADLA